ncbi:MAG: cytosine deaminase-like metal-dependent hydrolase [Bacteroidota bacterium]|nr:cytosine deaminase-like metal-dependent hydrolase [Bacteroidota bacterium]
MRHLTADYIFTASSEPIKNGVITVDSTGTIVDVQPQGESINAEYFKGIICPGFINTHCHLELSHFKGEISEKAGMMGFIKELLSKRPHFSSEKIQQGIEDAESEMKKNGIVAVGDISNDNSSFLQKSKENLKYHTFLECFDLDASRADAEFFKAQSLKHELTNLCSKGSEVRSSIVPHAPYTVSEKLFSLIKSEALRNNSILSIHNQESAAENEFFESHTGLMFEAFSRMGVNMNDFPKSEMNSLRTIFARLPLSQKILFVHNTFTSANDIEWANSAISDLYWCTCPNANLYIENRLPDYNIFLKDNVKVTVGTDSLASNWSLSILDELKTITRHFPHIPLETLIVWATKNGAEFLGFKELGTIEKGKKPGLNLLKNLDGLKITPGTIVERII